MRFNTLPNWLTLARVLSFPAIVWLGSVNTPAYGMAAALVFTVASITDILDGWLARRWGQVSEFGKLVDPIADKILITTAFVMLVFLDRFRFFGALAPWMVTLIVAREFAVSGLRAHAGSAGVVIPAGSAGKVKATFQVLAIIFLFASQWTLLYVPLAWLGNSFFGVAFVTTMWSGYRYFRDYAKAIQR